MIDIDGTNYIIDMDALMAWVSETPTSEKNISTITTVTYPAVEEDNIVEKEISESKSTLNEVMNNVRYDFARILINTIVSTYVSNGGEFAPYSISDMNIGQKIAFNTLLAKGIIKEA